MRAAKRRVGRKNKKDGGAWQSSPLLFAPKGAESRTCRKIAFASCNIHDDTDPPLKGDTSIFRKKKEKKKKQHEWELSS